MSTESVDVARRRLAQSEGEFRQCISIDPRDEYGYQGLATLYVDWAERSKEAAEATEYLGKAETIITEGLRRVRVRDGLWIVSSRIQTILGNTPKFMAALEKAASGTPPSVVAKYLLGRAYRHCGEPRRAIEILNPVFEANTEEFRVCVELARAMEEVGKPYSRCIAVLRLSTLYGLSDPRFVATLGGMLFMNAEFSPAAEIFTQALRREFPAPEASRIQYRPRDPRNSLFSMKLIGKVGAVKTGYAFIEAPGYPSFFCPGSKFGRLVMKQGLQVRFEPVFNTKGQLADVVVEPTASE